MKKLFSLTLALLLILSMTATAFAAEVTYAPTAEVKDVAQIKKTYTVPNGSGITAINETLKFTSTPQSTNPDYYQADGTTKNTNAANLTVSDLTVSNLTNGEAGKVKFTIPALSKAGTYEWIITEEDGNTAGVSYTESQIHVVVYVGYDNESTTKALKILNTTSYIKKPGDDAKVDTFNNTLKLGSFTVEKDVQGNMANENDDFTITVTLTSNKKVGTKIKVGGNDVETTEWTKDQTKDEWTCTKTLTISESDGATAFSNIPVGVTVTVAENNVGTDKKVGAYTYKGVFTRTTSTDENDNTTTNDEEFSSLTIEENTNSRIVVVNENKTEVATGVSLDTVPYFLMLAVACVGMFLVLSRKRAYREN